MKSTPRTHVIPGRAPREPGIHNLGPSLSRGSPWLWIPDILALLGFRNDPIGRIANRRDAAWQAAAFAAGECQGHVALETCRAHSRPIALAKTTLTLIKLNGRRAR